MDGYLIGAGAILTAGDAATISGATLHARTDPHLARQVSAAVIDFESPSPQDLTRLVVVAAGWDAARFRREFATPLLTRRECSLADVIVDLGRAVGVGDVHLFARWLPEFAVIEAASGAGVTVVSHPIESILQAALVSGQAVRRWGASLSAA
ncbi:MAG: hypothetical protein ACLQPV_00370 [Vulcanimicrobiaceae bacterium]